MKTIYATENTGLKVDTKMPTLQLNRLAALPVCCF